MKKRILSILILFAFSGVLFAEEVPVWLKKMRESVKDDKKITSNKMDRMQDDRYIMFSYSARTPNIEPNPTDFEFSIGGATYISEIAFLKGVYVYERDNGRIYRQNELLAHAMKYDPFGKIVSKFVDVRKHQRAYLYINESRDINYQTTDISYELMKMLEMGYSVYFREFEKAYVMYFSRIKLSFLKADIRLNPYLTSINTRIGKKHFFNKTKKGLYFYPYYRYIYEKSEDDKNIFSQFKIEIGYNF